MEDGHIDTNELEGLKDQVYGDYVESLVPLLKGDSSWKRWARRRWPTSRPSV